MLSEIIPITKMYQATIKKPSLRTKETANDVLSIMREQMEIKLTRHKPHISAYTMRIAEASLTLQFKAITELNTPSSMSQIIQSFD